MGPSHGKQEMAKRAGWRMGRDRRRLGYVEEKGVKEQRKREGCRCEGKMGNQEAVG